MKRLWMLILTLCMVFALAACGAKTVENAPSNQETAAPSQSENDSKTEENSQTDELPSDTETLETVVSDTEESDVSEETGSKILVAYFSCTGNTEGIAEKIAEVLDADTYEIVPEQPYTEEDLNYSDRTTRATAEQDNPDARPAISGSVENMDDYEIVVIGYPIWWGAGT